MQLFLFVVFSPTIDQGPALNIIMIPRIPMATVDSKCIIVCDSTQQLVGKIIYLKSSHWALFLFYFIFTIQLITFNRLKNLLINH